MSISEFLEEAYRQDVERHFRTVSMLDKMMYARPYTEDEEERCRDINNMVDQYWHDQYALALSKAKGRFRKILKLHCCNKNGECEGCDYSGYEGEPPQWPCRTVIMACKGTDHHKTHFVWPKRPKRKSGKGTVTVPVTTRRPNA